MHHAGVSCQWSGWLQHALEQPWQQVRQLGGRVQAGEAGEVLHDFRVHLRQLRYALRLVAPQLAGQADVVQAQLAVWNRLSGEARDHELLCQQLQRLAVQAPVEQQQAWQGLTRTLCRQAQQKQAQLVRSLSVAAWQRAESGMTGVLSSLVVAFADWPPLRASLLPWIRRRRRKLWTCYRQYRQQPDPQQLHLLRLSIKKLRYLLLMVQMCTGKRGLRLARQLGEFQDHLGQQQDEQSMRVLLSEERLPTRLSLAARQLAAGLRQQGMVAEKVSMAKPARRRLKKLLRGKGWRRLKRRLRAG